MKASDGWVDSCGVELMAGTWEWGRGRCMRIQVKLKRKNKTKMIEHIKEKLISKKETMLKK